jgi:hypothetical protein
MLDTGMYNLNRAVAIANAAANNGDYVPVATSSAPAESSGASRTSAPRSARAASCAAVYRAGVLVQNISAASTAAAASITTGVALANLDAWRATKSFSS